MLIKTSSELRQTTCPYCGVGCGVDVHVDVENKIHVRGSDSHPANLGRLCVKGTSLGDSVTNANRLLYPRYKGVNTDWGNATAVVAEKFQWAIDNFGPQSVAFYLSGQLLTEDYYVANKLMKGFLGSANVDTNSRLCMASAVAGYKRAFGADAVPCSYEDLDSCELLILAGSNAAWTHPVLYQRVVAAKQANTDLKVVVIDPRHTSSCDIADLHLQLLPGSDGFLFNGLFHYLYQSGFCNLEFIQNHTQSIEETAIAASECDTELVAEKTGLERHKLLTFFQLFASTEKTVTFFSQGINQSVTGTDKCNAIINCHLLTGRIGAEGMGPFSITGQPNAMGGREVGGLANQLAAHMDFNPGHVDRLRRFWQAPNMAEQPGLKAVDLFDAIERGEIKALWIMATNPVVSLPESDRIRAALEKCEFVVVSDCVEKTDTNACADMLLPATGWGEKDGTVTNSERRISRQRPLFHPPGEARHDWQIVCDVARKMGFEKEFSYQTPREIFVEHAALSGYENDGERKFDIGLLQFMSEQDYEAMVPIQWPVTPQAPGGTARLFTDKKFQTESGKANFIPVKAELSVPQGKNQDTFLLNTGRLRDQWHSMTRTGENPKLLRHFDGPCAMMSPLDREKVKATEGKLVKLANKLGDVLLPIKFDSGIAQGQVFVPIHWSDSYAGNARIAKLIASISDPVSGQPESKLAAVSIQTVEVKCWIAVFSKTELSLGEFDYWHKVPLRGGYRYLLGLKSANQNQLDLGRWIEKLSSGSEIVRFSDPARHVENYIWFAEEELQLALFASSLLESLPQSEWIASLAEKDYGPENWELLAGISTEQEHKGALICSCYEVGENQILAAIRGGCTDYIALGKKLRCGTNCGSCVPELKQLVNQHCGNSTQVQAGLLSSSG